MNEILGKIIPNSEGKQYNSSISYVTRERASRNYRTGRGIKQHQAHNLELGVQKFDAEWYRDMKREREELLNEENRAVSHRK